MLLFLKTLMQNQLNIQRLQVAKHCMLVLASEIASNKLFNTKYDGSY